MSKTKYPWSQWKDGTVHGLEVKGDSAEEADDKVKRLRNSLYVHAKRTDFSVRTLVDEPDEATRYLRFQMLPREDGEEGFSDIFHSTSLEGVEPLDLAEDGTLAVA